MGYMTVAVILNDQLDMIAKDPEFGQKLVSGIHELAGARRPISVGRGQCCTLVDQHHTSHTTVLAVGGNHTSILGRAWTYQHLTLEDQEFILKFVLKDVQERIKKDQSEPLHASSF